jgi:hypothetical protein
MADHRTTAYHREMGKLLIATSLLAFAACQPMYGGKSGPLRNPDPIKPPKDLPVEVAKVPYVEDCELITRAVKNPRRDSKRAQIHVRTGDAKIADAEVATEPVKRGDLFVDGIDQYNTALTSDPFDAEATLKAAVAYDKVLRKGCALALLRRLDQLAQNPVYADDANRKIDAVTDNKKWFEGYRRDALKAVGR